jgi:hypothetical protein
MDYRYQQHPKLNIFSRSANGEHLRRPNSSSMEPDTKPVRLPPQHHQGRSRVAPRAGGLQPPGGDGGRDHRPPAASHQPPGAPACQPSYGRRQAGQSPGLEPGKNSLCSASKWVGHVVSYCSLRATAISHLGWTQVKIVSAQFQSRLLMWVSYCSLTATAKLVSHLGWTQVKIISAQLQK